MATQKWMVNGKSWKNPSMIWGYPHFRKPPYGYIVLYHVISPHKTDINHGLSLLVSFTGPIDHLGTLKRVEFHKGCWLEKREVCQDGNHLDLSSDVDNTSNTSKINLKFKHAKSTSVKKNLLGIKFCTQTRPFNPDGPVLCLAVGMKGSSLLHSNPAALRGFGAGCIRLARNIRNRKKGLGKAT